MKTAQQGLSEAYKQAGQNAYFGNGFMAGIEFAQRWIDAKLELPKSDELYLVKFDLDESKLVGGLKTGNIYVSYFCDGRWVIEEQGGGLIVAEWRSIAVS